MPTMRPSPPLVWLLGRQGSDFHTSPWRRAEARDLTVLGQELRAGFEDCLSRNIRKEKDGCRMLIKFGVFFQKIFWKVDGRGACFRI